jgi:predicted amidohydrolase
MTAVPVAVGQFAAGDEPAANLATAAALTATAAGRGARLVVLPEYAMFATATLDDRIVASAQPLDGPFATGVSELAARHRVTLLVGMNEALPDSDRIANTLLAVGPDGALLGTYRKLHLYDAFGFTESARVAPGAPDQLLTFGVDGITVGAMTCYDLRFPELARQLVDAGAGALAVPAQWVPGPQKEDHWRTLARARAIENTVYVLAAGQCAPMGAGNSLIADPMGVVVAAAGEAAGVAVGELDPDRLAAVRRKNPSLAHRRFRVSPA